MANQIHHIIKDKIEKGEKIILDLGSGPTSRTDRITVDMLPLSGIDIVADLEKGLSFAPDNSVDEIHSKSFFEHVDNFDLLMREMHRVLKPGGMIYIFVPHFSNPYYYSDPTHKRFFGYYTFYYYSKNQDKLTRQVPSFYTDLDFEVVSQWLYFSGTFFIPMVFKKYILGKIVNLHVRTQEFYEAHLSNTFSCYGMDIILKVRK
ncbi:hypothetical protein COB64_00480 [Candidatus Wolfebacteria bacterium]|nr:MAG: hypothetical protein COB64_00480 [Candidatus Wolfebacteria bacterium]